MQARARMTEQPKKHVVVKAALHKHCKHSKKTTQQVRVAADDRCEFFVAGVRCPRRLTAKRYCDLHSEPKPAPVPKDDCPVCFEPSNQFKWFGCGHGLCMTCLPQICEALCPVCREPIGNVLVKAEAKRIATNAYNKHRDAEREEAAVARTMRFDSDEEEDSLDESLSGDEGLGDLLMRGGEFVMLEPASMPRGRVGRVGRIGRVDRSRGVGPDMSQLLTRIMGYGTRQHGHLGW
jgi:Zinc finger, C3HC4 type (RING finger)